METAVIIDDMDEAAQLIALLMHELDIASQTAAALTGLANEKKFGKMVRLANSLKDDIDNHLSQILTAYAAPTVPPQYDTCQITTDQIGNC